MGLLGIVFAVILIVCSYCDIKNNSNIQVSSLYQVYLNGNQIGLIEDKDALYNLINEEQDEIKNTYDVSTVYPPNNLEIIKVNTYNDEISDIEDVYRQIEQKDDFTVKGYIITITGTEEANSSDSTDEDLTSNENSETVEVEYTINVLDKEVFDEAIHNYINVFIDEDDYENFINDTQEEIVDVGQIIEAMYFDETITIKEGYISTNSKIYTDASELTQYLLYGDDYTEKEYTVQKGDTISSIAENNKLNVQEFLIANSKFKSEDSLLAIGENVNVSLIDPILSLNYELHVVEDVEQVYEKETVYDKTKDSSYSEVTQAGVTGITRVTQKVKMVNGESSQGTVIVNQEVIREKVNEITTKGSKYTSSSGGVENITGSYVDTGLSWGWPTNSPYIITSPYAWRWGKMHEGLDISGTGYGSPIYAAGAGTVVKCGLGTGSWWSFGNYVIIDHGNNYYTLYAHMASVSVSNGQSVSRGQIIGKMGSTGNSTGTHLHFSVSIGEPYTGSYKFFNPMSLY